MTEAEFQAHKTRCMKQARELADVDDASAVAEATTRLVHRDYSPTLILPTKGFIAFTKADLVREIERVARLSDEDLQAAGFDATRDFRKVKAEHISLLVYHFAQLVRLRRDEADAWDEVDELFGDD